MNQLFLLKVEMKITAFVIKYIWPILRIFVKHKLKNRCKICTLSEEIVSLDEQGICHLCHQSHQTINHNQQSVNQQSINQLSIKKDEQKNRLDKIFDHAQQKGKQQHDVLVLFSGGKDSTYLLNRIKTNYPQLRILALTINTGLQSPFGQKNAKHVCEKLAVDHLEVNYCDVFIALFKFGFKNLVNKGFYCIDFFEGELMQDIGRHFAASHKIPYVVWGITSKQSDTINSEFDEYKLYRDIHEPIFSDNQFFTRSQYMGYKLKSIFTEDQMNYWWDASRYLPEDVPTMLFPFHAWDYDKKQVVDEVLSLNIINEIDPYLTNDLHISLGVFLDYQLMGYCSVEPEWAKLVREGLEDRKENLYTWELVEYYFLKHKNILLKGVDVSMVLHKLDMTIDDVNGIIAAN